jgi:hypothetical protein
MYSPLKKNQQRKLPPRKPLLKKQTVNLATVMHRQRRLLPRRLLQRKRLRKRLLQRKLMLFRLMKRQKHRHLHRLRPLLKYP